MLFDSNGKKIAYLIFLNILFNGGKKLPTQFSKRELSPFPHHPGGRAGGVFFFNVVSHIS